MLQTNFDGDQIQVAVFNPSTDKSHPRDSRLKAPCSTTERFLGLFEDITGWQVEFAESDASLRQRTDYRKLPNAVSPEQAPSAVHLPQGTFSIVDMSENWPARTPTAHRGKCDQLISVIDELANELQTTKTELARSQSALAAFDPNAKFDESGLVDSFVPKFGSRLTDAKFVVDTDAFVLQSPVVHDTVESGNGSLVAPPFEGWELGGQTGIVNNLFLDWMVDEEERISICAGDIESEGKTRELKIVVDPLTNEYRVEVEAETCLDQSLPAELGSFFVWDSKTLNLQPIESGNWTRLKSSQAIVATTAKQVDRNQCLGNLVCEDADCESLAEMLRSSLGGKDPIVVLKRI